MRIEDYAKNSPALRLEDYFPGRSRAYGVVEDPFGRVVRQFVVDIGGTWNGETLTLVEDFVWNDGETERRVWELTRVGASEWHGRTADSIGVARGREAGNAFNLRYALNLRMGARRVRVDFDDWMFLQPDGVLLNRARIRKFGMTLATVTIAFRRESLETARSAPHPTLVAAPSYAAE